MEDKKERGNPMSDDVMRTYTPADDWCREDDTEGTQISEHEDHQQEYSPLGDGDDPLTGMPFDDDDRPTECPPETPYEDNYYGLEGEQKNIALDIRGLLIEIANQDRAIAAHEAVLTAMKAAYIARAEGTNEAARKAWVETELTGDTGYLDQTEVLGILRYQRAISLADYEAAKTAARLMVAGCATELKPRIVKIGFGRTIPGPQSYSSVRFDAEVECCVDADGSPKMVVETREHLMMFVDSSLAIAQTPPDERNDARVAYPVEKEGY